MVAIGSLEEFNQLSELLTEALSAMASELEAAVTAVVSQTSGQAHQIGSGAVQRSIKCFVRDNVAIVGSDDPAVIVQELGTHSSSPRPFLAPVASKQAEHIVRSVATHISDRLGARLD